MLRKSVHIILVMLLLVSSTGVTFSMHYCGGELVSTSINKEAKTCCDGTGGCCENKTMHIEIDDDYISSIVVENSIIELDILFPVLFALYSDLIPVEANVPITFNDSSPPPKIQIRLSFLQTYLC